MKSTIKTLSLEMLKKDVDDIKDAVASDFDPPWVSLHLDKLLCNIPHDSLFLWKDCDT